MSGVAPKQVTATLRDPGRLSALGLASIALAITLTVGLVVGLILGPAFGVAFGASALLATGGVWALVVAAGAQREIDEQLARSAPRGGRP